MREVAAALDATVVADESVKGFDDLHDLVETRYAGAVNLKLAKLGGVLVAVRMGLAAQAAGLAVMAGGMVETRLGMTAAAHVACALGGVDFVDLDTAWLLAGDPYTGGYEAEGPTTRCRRARAWAWSAWRAEEASCRAGHRFGRRGHRHRAPRP